jgi:hypothetical protein
MSKTIISLAAILILASLNLAGAQQPKKVPTIGFYRSSPRLPLPDPTWRHSGWDFGSLAMLRDRTF